MSRAGEVAVLILYICYSLTNIWSHMEPTQPYEIKSLDDLKKNAKNPRRISKEDFEALKASIKKFGDLSCVVFNVRTGQLVGGHQRVEAIRTMNPPARVGVMERHAPDEKGTVAEGTIYVGNDSYKYREVDWDAGTEKAANVAANRIQGEFDLDLLAELNYELSQIDNGADLLKLTGQSESEIAKLLQMVTGEPEIALPEGDKPGFQTMTFTLADDQAAILNEAITYMKEHESFEGMENSNSNGNAIYLVAREFLDYVNGLKDEPSQTNPS